MLDYEILEAANKEDLIKLFRNWVKENPDVNILLPTIQSHIVRKDDKRLLGFYLMFMFTKQSKLMPGQHRMA